MNRLVWGKQLVVQHQAESLELVEQAALLHDVADWKYSKRPNNDMAVQV